MDSFLLSVEARGMQVALGVVCGEERGGRLLADAQRGRAPPAPDKWIVGTSTRRTWGSTPKGREL